MSSIPRREAAPRSFLGRLWLPLTRPGPTRAAVIFCAALSIDFDFFENNQGSRGLLDGFGN